MPGRTISFLARSQRSARASAWASRPVGSSILAKDRPQQHNDGEEQPLHCTRNEWCQLGPAMPIHDMRHVKDWRAVGCTCVEHLEHGLQVAVEVNRRCSQSSNHQLFVTVIPPRMDASFWKTHMLASFEHKPPAVHQNRRGA